MRSGVLPPLLHFLAPTTFVPKPCRGTIFFYCLLPFLIPDIYYGTYIFFNTHSWWINIIWVRIARTPSSFGKTLSKFLHQNSMLQPRVNLCLIQIFSPSHFNRHLWDTILTQLHSIHNHHWIIFAMTQIETSQTSHRLTNSNNPKHQLPQLNNKIMSWNTRWNCILGVGCFPPQHVNLILNFKFQ